MLGKDRFQFESPSLDAGEAPPSRPGRRKEGGGGTRSPRTLRAHDIVSKDERLFRGTKINISNHSEEEGDEENPCSSISTSGSCEGSTGMLDLYEGDEEGSEENWHAGEAPPSRPARRGRGQRSGTRSPRTVRAQEIETMLEFYEDDAENQHDQLPSPDEARMYAAALLSGSLHRHSDSDSDGDAAWAAEALANDEAKPLSSSAIWMRPSRRKSHQARKTIADRQQTQKSRWLLGPTIRCGILFLATAITFFVVVITVSVRKGNSASSSSDNPIMDVEDEMVNSPRFLQTIEWLSEHGISNMQLLTTADSPQYQAARWIADMDAMMENIPVSVHTDPDSLQQHNVNGTTDEQHEAHHHHVVKEKFLQRYVLAVFFFSTGGPNWDKALSFLSENHECAWFDAEIANDEQEFAVGVTCNEKLLVVDIFIPGNNLVGQIPSEIQYLRHLELLGLRKNYVEDIPNEIVQLSTTLEYLDISKNNFKGTVPEYLGYLQELKVLGLASNAFSGSLPTQLSKLYNLVTLDLGYNEMLTGHVGTVIGQMTKLEHLHLEANSFEDTMDDSFFINLRHLKELTLNDNKFSSTGQLPFHLISHQNLTVLDLSRNVLSGSLPSTFLSTSNSNSKMKFLSLGGNRLNGTLPEALQMLSHLEYIDFSSNSFAGPIPVSLGNLKSLTHAYLGSNNFDAAIIPPVFFTDMNLHVLVSVLFAKTDAYHHNIVLTFVNSFFRNPPSLSRMPSLLARFLHGSTC